MGTLRNCTSNSIYAGVSKCPIEFDKVVGAILMKRGGILSINGDAITCSTDYVVLKPFVEFAQDGGEANIGAIGYGGNKVTGFSPATYTFTMDTFEADTLKGLLNDMNGNYDVVFYDKDNVFYGVRKTLGTNGQFALGGIPLSSVYPKATPHPTSGENATLQVAFALKDVETAWKNFDYIASNYDASKIVAPMCLAWCNVDTNTWKVVENTGRLDVTTEFVTLVGTTALANAMGVTTATSTDGKITTTGTPVCPKTIALGSDLARAYVVAMIKD